MTICKKSTLLMITTSAAIASTIGLNLHQITSHWEMSSVIDPGAPIYDDHDQMIPNRTQARIAVGIFCTLSVIGLALTDFLKKDTTPNNTTDTRSDLDTETLPRPNGP